MFLPETKKKNENKNEIFFISDISELGAKQSIHRLCHYALRGQQLSVSTEAQNSNKIQL